MSFPGLENPPTENKKLLEWVEQVAALAKPDRIEWCDGSQEEWDRLTQLMVQDGMAIPLNPELRPNSFLFRSEPHRRRPGGDAHVHLLGTKPDDAGPTNNWDDPIEMTKTLDGLFDGCMRGRTMYVIPFSMGPLGWPISASWASRSPTPPTSWSTCGS